MNVQGTSLGNIFSEENSGIPKTLYKKLARTEIRTNLTLVEWLDVDEKNIMMLFQDRSFKYMKEKCAPPAPRYLYKVNCESGENEFLASGGNEIGDLVFSEGKLLGRKSNEKDEWTYYRIDEKSKKFIVADESSDAVKKQKKINETEKIIGNFKINSYRTWRRPYSNCGQFIQVYESLQGKFKNRKFTVALFDKDATQPTKTIDYQFTKINDKDRREPSLEVVCAFSETAIFLEYFDTLVFYDLTNEKEINRVDLGMHVQYSEARFLDDQNILVLVKDHYNDGSIYLNGFSLEDGKYLWKNKLQIFRYPAYWGWPNFKWELTEKVHRISARRCLDGMSPSDHYGLSICDLNKKELEPQKIQFKINPVHHYSGDFRIMISPEIHKALADKAEENGETIQKFLQKKLPTILE